MTSAGSTAPRFTGVAPICGQGEAVGFLVDHEHLRRPPQQRAVGGHQADRAGAEHRDGLPRGHLGEFGAVVAGGEDVGQHRVIGLVLGARGQLEEVEVRPRDPQQLRLPTPVGAHLGVAVPGSRVPGRVRPQTRRGEPVVAVAAAPARQVKRHRHPVTHPDPGDRRPDLLHDPHVLVAQDHALLQGGPTLIRMQIRPADVRGRDPDHRVQRVLDPRVGHLLHRKGERTVIHDSLQRRLPVQHSGAPRCLGRRAAARTGPTVGPPVSHRPPTRQANPGSGVHRTRPGRFR